MYAYLPGEGGQRKQRDNVMTQVGQTLPDGRGAIHLRQTETARVMELVLMGQAEAKHEIRLHVGY
jgi:hypothetical protein